MLARGPGHAQPPLTGPGVAVQHGVASVPPVRSVVEALSQSVATTAGAAALVILPTRLHDRVQSVRHLRLLWHRGRPHIVHLRHLLVQDVDSASVLIILELI